MTEAVELSHCQWPTTEVTKHRIGLYKITLVILGELDGLQSFTCGKTELHSTRTFDLTGHVMQDTGTLHKSHWFVVLAPFRQDLGAALVPAQVWVWRGV